MEFDVMERNSPGEFPSNINDFASIRHAVAM